MEPEIIRNLREMHSGTIIDRSGDLIRFLKNEYYYEIQRNPIHPLFEKNYSFKTFIANEMLGFYMNPAREKVAALYLFIPGYVTRISILILFTKEQ